MAPGAGSKKESAPLGLDRGRHQQLQRRTAPVWSRRVALLAVAAIPILGLLNVFGQRAHSIMYRGDGASISIDSPAHVRSGLIFTTRIVIQPTRDLHHARLYLADGWFRGMTYNAIAPQPPTQTSSGRWVILGFGSIPAGQTFPVWISWQANPTNVGRRSQDVELYEGSTRLVTANRTITIFP
jgi:hypothetical protein